MPKLIDSYSGYRFFPTALANTVDGNGVVTEAVGAELLIMKGRVYEPLSTNYFLNSLAPATQIIITTAQTYTLSIVGSGDITLTGTATGTATEGSPITVIATAGSLTCTVNGTVSRAQVEPGSAATSIIETEGTAVSRAAVVDEKVWTAGLVNNLKLTCTFTYSGYDSINDAYIFGVGSGATTESMQGYVRASDGKLRFVIYIGSTGYGITSNAALVVGTTYDLGFIYNSGMSMVIDSVAQTDTDAVTTDLRWSDPETLFIGSDYAGANGVAANIQDILVTEL